ncbi:MAG: IPT/TIG domain-containing protein [Bacteroidota bacterium]
MRLYRTQGGLAMLAGMMFLLVACGGDDGTDVPAVGVTIQDQTFEINEEPSLGTVIGTVAASNTGEGALSFTIVSQTPDGAVAIDAVSGQLTVAELTAFDFETNTSVSLTVAASADGTTAEATVTVTIIDRDEAANQSPVIANQSFEVAEEISDDTLIGQVVASDPDGDALNFRMNTNDNDLFEITSEGELSLAPGKSLDFETASTHTVTIAAEDGLESSAAFITITVTDVADNDGTTAPTITGFQPTSGTPGTLVNISGTNFSTTPGENKVFFDGVAATIFSENGNTLLVRVPANAATGTISVQVGDEVATSTNSFTVLSMIITTIDPLFGFKNDQIEIAGDNFSTDASTQVRFLRSDGTEVSIVPQNITKRLITVRVPPAAVTGPITVRKFNGDLNEAETVTSESDFFVNSFRNQITDVNAGSSFNFFFDKGEAAVINATGSSETLIRIGLDREVFELESGEILDRVGDDGIVFLLPSQITPATYDWEDWIDDSNSNGVPTATYRTIFRSVTGGVSAVDYQSEEDLDGELIITLHDTVNRRITGTFTISFDRGFDTADIPRLRDFEGSFDIMY